MTPDQAVEFMKKHKILHFECEGLKITLHPAALEPDPDPSFEPERPLDDKERSPVSGMTRKEMFDTLGHVIESEFVKRQ